MVNRTVCAAIAALCVGLGTGAMAASEAAGGGDQQELAAVASARITLQQATAIAEKETGGKATASGIDNENGVTTYDVTIDQGGAPKQVLADLQTGKVVKVAAETGAEGAEGAEGPETNDGDTGQENEGTDQKKG